MCVCVCVCVCARAHACMGEVLDELSGISASSWHVDSEADLAKVGTAMVQPLPPLRLGVGRLCGEPFSFGEPCLARF